MATGIQWTDETWNPVSGCSKVSQGCKHCYAERVFPRPYPGRKFIDVRTHDDRLQQPLRWRKPRRVFVNSMSDLFHEDVPDAFIDQVFAIMAMAKQHTFQVLTKRPDRMIEWFKRVEGGGAEGEDAALAKLYGAMTECAAPMPAWVEADFEIGEGSLMGDAWPLPNVWIGVSVEDQETADERIPLLLRTPAAVRFISAEPLLGAIDLTRIHHDTWPSEPNRDGEQYTLYMSAFSGIRPTSIQSYVESPTLDWVIVGGESGPKARPCDVEWIGGIVNQCKDAGVPVFVKQFGARPIAQCRACSTHRALCRLFGSDEGEHGHDGIIPIFMKDRKGGDPAEWPADLRVREFPA